jgi:hypothetical protein
MDNKTVSYPQVVIRKRNPQQKEIVLKRFSLSYSRTTHDQRQYNVNHYIPHFLDLFAQQCRQDIEDAKKRIYKTRYNTFRYHPSREYMNFITALKQRKIVAMV